MSEGASDAAPAATGGAGAPLLDKPVGAGPERIHVRLRTQSLILCGIGESRRAGGSRAKPAAGHTRSGHACFLALVCQTHIFGSGSLHRRDAGVAQAAPAEAGALSSLASAIYIPGDRARSGRGFVCPAKGRVLGSVPQLKLINLGKELQPFLQMFAAFRTDVVTVERDIWIFSAH